MPPVMKSAGAGVRVLIGALLATEAIRLLLGAVETACRARGSQRFALRLKKRLFGNK